MELRTEFARDRTRISLFEETVETGRHTSKRINDIMQQMPISTRWQLMTETCVVPTATYVQSKQSLETSSPTKRLRAQQL